MTTEEAFQAALDANPDDHVTRLVFADWLQEQGDPRAEGYRALGRNQISPYFSAATQLWVIWNGDAYLDADGGCEHRLPGDWFTQAYKAKCNYFQRESRREIDNAAALAFSRLPPERRAELLAGQAVKT